MNDDGEVEALRSLVSLPWITQQHFVGMLQARRLDQIKFSSLSAPTKIEELTAGSDEKTQRSPAGNRTQGLANSSRTL